MDRRARNTVSTIAEKMVKQYGPEKAIKIFRDLEYIYKNRAASLWAEPEHKDQAKEADNDAFCCNIAIIYIQQRWSQ